VKIQDGILCECVMKIQGMAGRKSIRLCLKSVEIAVVYFV